MTEAELAKARTSIQKSQTQEHELSGKIKNLEQQLQESKASEEELNGKVTDLEDEMEVLQEDLDDALERERARAPSHEMNGELERLEQKISTLQKDLELTRSERDEALQSAQKPTSGNKATFPSPSHRDLEQRIQSLKSQLASSKAHSASLQSQLTSQQSNTRSTTETQRTLNNLQSENRSLSENLHVTLTELQTLQTHLSDLEHERDDLRSQLSTSTRDAERTLKGSQREAERRLQSQISAYEHDIQNLEQDLEDAGVKGRDLARKLESSDSKVEKLRCRVSGLEAEVAQGKTVSPPTVNGKPTASEKALNDATRKTSDLAGELEEKQNQITSLQNREVDLRNQLKRTRAEYKNSTSRAEEATANLVQLQNKYDNLASASLPQNNVAPQTVEKTAKRHALELRGLTKQIEYLAARVNRSERMREDAAYAKNYVVKLVECSAAWRGADLELVEGMGVPVGKVMRQAKNWGFKSGKVEGGEEEYAREMPALPPISPCVNKSSRSIGRAVASGQDGKSVETVGRNGKLMKPVKKSPLHEQRLRPTLHVLAIAVRATVRIAIAARRWREVRRGHDKLIKGLIDRKRIRNEGEGVTNVLRKRK